MTDERSSICHIYSDRLTVFWSICYSYKFIECVRVLVMIIHFYLVFKMRGFCILIQAFIEGSSSL